MMIISFLYTILLQLKKLCTLVQQPYCSSPLFQILTEFDLYETPHKRVYSVQAKTQDS